MRTQTVLALLAAAAFAASAQAEDKYTFPSVGGASMAAGATPAFATGAQVEAGTLGAGARGAPQLGLQPPSPSYRDRFGSRPSSEAYGFRFLTHALGSRPFANYAADYYRIFAPGYAVQSWTDRVVSGYVEAGYGGAVDGWTAGAYYLSNLRGPRNRRETAPDLSAMPEIRRQPELDRAPTFTRD